MVYRDARLLLCPRCGEVLERIRASVQSCGRCEGVWLEHAVLERAFGSKRFPIGPSAWWRRALACPECTSTMAPVMVGDMFVDRCGEHGLWLDQGELGRFIGAPGVIELEALHKQIDPDAPIPPALVARDQARKAEVERRRREIEDYRAKLVEEQRRLAEEQDAAARRAADERRKELQAKLERAAEQRRLEEEKARRAAEERLELLRATLQRERDGVTRDIGHKERALVALRAQVRTAESELSDARARLLELERQIAALVVT